MRNNPAFPRAVKVLYEDRAVVAIDKPAGLPATPIPGSNAPSALSVLDVAEKRHGHRVYVVHRIDRFVSGVLLFAKTYAAREVLVSQFLKHTPVRQYLAVIRGRMPEKEGKLSGYFRRKGMFQKTARVENPDSSLAELFYHVERPLRGASLVRVSLVTGLQNQIRVQFSDAGHPLIGDRKYHPEEAAETRIARVALHAAHLEFDHPVSGEKVTVEAPPPADFKALVNSLSRTDRVRGG